jgi:CRP-like cAMP-binding protein
MPTTPVLERMLRKIETRTPLEAPDREALLALPFTLRTLEPSAYVVREGERTTRCCVILSGFAVRQKLTSDGRRQILNVSLPGDIVDLECSLLNVADHNIQALTRCDVAFIPREELRRLIARHARIAEALWVDTLIDAAIFREWQVNLGRRDARTRIAHLLCELARRLESAGLASEYRYELPMTQEQLADATGMTAVHVNRTLRELDRDGLIQRNRRFVGIPNWEKLCRVGDFDETYLHLDHAANGAAEDVAA